MYGWLRQRIGLVGFLGTVAYLVGNIVTAAGHLTVELFVAYPYAHHPETAHLIAADDTMLGTTGFALFNNLGGLVMLAGMGMLGASLLRSRAVPRWIAWLTLAGMVGFFLPLPAVWDSPGSCTRRPAASRSRPSVC